MFDKGRLGGRGPMVDTAGGFLEDLKNAVGDRLGLKDKLIDVRSKRCEVDVVGADLVEGGGFGGGPETGTLFQLGDGGSVVVFGGCFGADDETEVCGLTQELDAGPS